jgi:NADPH-dependent 2,4-dienoyl-CoA reductase/sulfur reductase-like enzyme
VEAARRRGFTGVVTLVGAEEHLPYDRPPLSKAILAAGGPTEVPPLRSADHLRDELGVELMLGAPATALRPEDRVVVVGDRELRYDGLVVATGASPRTLRGTSGVAGVHTLRTVEDARRVRTALDAGARTVVVGAGFIGSEVASAARARGLPVTVVEALDVPLSRSVGAEAGLVCAELHQRHGTDLRLGSGVAEVLTKQGAVVGVRLDDGSRLPADLVVVGIGAAPSTAWLQGSGLTLHERDGGVVCDARLSTGLPGVYAAGDLAHWANRLFDDDVMRLEHWTNAAEHGAAAAAHALDPGTARPVVSVPYFWSDWYGHRIQFVGTPRADEVLRVDREPGQPLLLYRRGERLVGTLSIDRPTEIMKYRRMVAGRAHWGEALAFSRTGVLSGT